MPYRGKPSNVREIGKTLGVGAILEGSVRRIGNRVRVNVQLIKCRHRRAHVGGRLRSRLNRRVRHSNRSGTTDRTRIAGQTVTSRRRRKSSADPLKMARLISPLCRPTIFPHAVESLEKLKQSEQLYQRAIDLDPKLCARDCALLAIAKLVLERRRAHTGTARKSAHSSGASHATAA